MAPTNIRMSTTSKMVPIDIIFFRRVCLGCLFDFYFPVPPIEFLTGRKPRQLAIISFPYPTPSIGELPRNEAVSSRLSCILDGPSHSRVYASSPSMYVESGATFQDEYVYYPSYQIYYSSTRRQYIYQHNHTWVTRATPPRVSAEVLIASPSVRLDFHDAPAIHHASIVRQYPKKWAPPASTHGNNEERREKKHHSD